VPGHPCLSGVEPEEVVAAVQRLTTGVTSLPTRRETRNA
jgi:hypothetical protein